MRFWELWEEFEKFVERHRWVKFDNLVLRMGQDYFEGVTLQMEFSPTFHRHL